MDRDDPTTGALDTSASGAAAATTGPLLRGRATQERGEVTGSGPECSWTGPSPHTEYRVLSLVVTTAVDNRMRSTVRSPLRIQSVIRPS